MFWNYIASRVEAAVLAGVQRTLAKLDGNAQEGEHTEEVAALHLRILAAPPRKLRGPRRLPSPN